MCVCVTSCIIYSVYYNIFWKLPTLHQNSVQLQCFQPDFHKDPTIHDATLASVFSLFLVLSMFINRGSGQWSLGADVTAAHPTTISE